jgi:hypothetical protein
MVCRFAAVGGQRIPADVIPDSRLTLRVHAVLEDKFGGGEFRPLPSLHLLLVAAYAARACGAFRA